jgi:hypothetical protein
VRGEEGKEGRKGEEGKEKKKNDKRAYIQIITKKNIVEIMLYYSPRRELQQTKNVLRDKLIYVADACGNYTVRTA